MDNKKLSSIEKLDKQIEVLSKREFKDRTKKETIKNRFFKTRKVIKNETTKSGLLDDLLSKDDSDTKVFGQNNIKTKRIDKVDDVELEIKKDDTVIDSEKEIHGDNILSILLIVAIIVLIILIII